MQDEIDAKEIKLIHKVQKSLQYLAEKRPQISNINVKLIKLHEAKVKLAGHCQNGELCGLCTPCTPLWGF